MWTGDLVTVQDSSFLDPIWFGQPAGTLIHDVMRTAFDFVKDSPQMFAENAQYHELDPAQE